VIVDQAAPAMDPRLLVVALAVLHRRAKGAVRPGFVGTESLRTATLGIRTDRPTSARVAGPDAPTPTPIHTPSQDSSRRSASGPVASVAERSRERQAIYSAQVDGLLDLVGGLVASGRITADALVAVVSRGDDELVAGLGVSGVQFPADGMGRWIGHHPADSADAIRYLHQAVAGGATHLAIPEPSRWWLDHYTGLATHLAAGNLLADVPGAGAVWALAADDAMAGPAPFEPVEPSNPAPDPARRLAQETHDQSVRGLRRWADVVLGPHRRVLVISRGEPALAGRTGQHFPCDAYGVYDGHPADDADALARLQAAFLDGAEFLLVPDAVSWWSTVYPRFWSVVRQGARIDRPGTGWLCDLSRCPDLGSGPSSPTVAPDQEPS